MANQELLKSLEKQERAFSNRPKPYQEHQRRMMPEKTCQNKFAFDSRDHAMFARGRMSDSGLRVYKCPWGNHWHLGRLDGKRNR